MLIKPSQASFKLFLPRQILPYVAHVGSPKFRRKIVQMIPSKLVKAIRDIVDVMDEHAQSIYYTKKRAVEEGDESIVGGGKDIMSVLRGFIEIRLLNPLYLLPSQ